MLRKSLLAVVAAVGLTSCLKDPVDSETTMLGKEQEKIMEEYVTANGLTAKKEALYDYAGNYFPVYTIVENKGDTITKYTKNEAIWVAYTIRTLDNKVTETKTATDSVLIYEGGYSGKVLGLSVSAGSFLGKGGKGKFLIPSTLGYGKNPPGGVEYNAILILDVEVIGRLSEDAQMQWYIKRNNLKNVQTTSSGLMISKTKVTTDSLVTGTTASVKFSGNFVNGFEFQKEASGTNMVLAEYISGFSEAVKLMRKGEKAVALMPSRIGYGENGGGKMPVYMPLIFNLELLDNK